MHILIIGAAGMLGAKLVKHLAHVGSLNVAPITKITRYDVVLPPPPPSSSFAIETQIGSLATQQEAQKIIQEKPDVIFHLAAIVSGEAETDFEKGYAINLDSTRYLLEAARLTPNYRPKFIFTSSIAVFGAPFPEAIDDEYFTTPLTSYGTQKAIGELLINDYSRRGFVDGLALRMPTICVRPGKANKAASSFFSNIIREPLAGLPANLPVSDQVRHWHISPRGAVRLLTHATSLDTSTLQNRRTLNMPGLSCTVAEQIEALRDVAGHETVKRITHEPDAFVEKIVLGWPRNFTAQRAIALGFQAEKSFREIIQIHIEDELTV